MENKGPDLREPNSQFFIDMLNISVSESSGMHIVPDGNASAEPYLPNGNGSGLDNHTSTSEPGQDCVTFNFIYDFIIIGSVCILGMCGNTLSIIILRRDHFNKVTLFLFQALAVADNTVLLMSFITLSVIYGLLPYTNAKMTMMAVVPYLIKYLHPFAYVSQLCAVWITVLLAIHRYIAICKPFRASRWNRMARARIQVALVVIGAMAFNLPRFFQVDIVRRTEVDSQNNETIFVYSIRETTIGEHTLFGKVYTNMLYTIIGLVIPLVLLVFLNSRLIREIRLVKKRTRIQGHPEFEDNNVTLIMVVIIIVVLVCHTPDRIFQVTKDFTDVHKTSCGHLLFYVLNACNLLIIINSSTNFIIYYVMRRGFRQILLKRFCSIISSSTNYVTEKSINEMTALNHHGNRFESVPTVKSVVYFNGDLEKATSQNGRRSV